MGEKLQEGFSLTVLEKGRGGLEQDCHWLGEDTVQAFQQEDSCVTHSGCWEMGEDEKAARGPFQQCSDKV